jgi:hypothetical protein
MLLSWLLGIMLFLDGHLHFQTKKNSSFLFFFYVFYFVLCFFIQNKHKFKIFFFYIRRGFLIHSHQYKEPVTSAFDFTDKRVVIVGIGNSGIDLANELSRVSKQVYLVSRTGALIWPKLTKDGPIDLVVRNPFWLLHLTPNIGYSMIGIVRAFQSFYQTHGSVCLLFIS